MRLILYSVESRLLLRAGISAIKRRIQKTDLLCCLEGKLKPDLRFLRYAPTNDGRVLSKILSRCRVSLLKMLIVILVVRVRNLAYIDHR